MNDLEHWLIEQNPTPNSEEIQRFRLPPDLAAACGVRNCNIVALNPQQELTGIPDNGDPLAVLITRERVRELFSLQITAVA